MAMAANATVYLLGAADGLGWDLPGKAVEATSDGVYQFTLTNASKFKVSTAEATDWDTYNGAAYATDGQFTDAVANAGGETLPVAINEFDQMLPWAGDYTITLDLNKMTMTAYTTTPKPTTATPLYIRGGMTGWNPEAMWQFSYNDTDARYYFVCKETTVIPAGVEFKIADSNWGALNFGYSGEIAPTAEGTTIDLVSNGGNMQVASDFSGILYVDVAATQATFVSGVYEYQPAGVEGVTVDEAEAVYYNLQGQKVLNPERGIFVKVVGTKAVKVVK